MIKQINSEDVFRLMRSSLALPNSKNGGLDDILLAASIRRLAGFRCPCSHATLVSEMLSSLVATDGNDDTLRDRVENVIEGLIMCGDLLELRDVSFIDLNVKESWIFAAPPSFVARQNGNIVVFGIVPDENSPLTFLSERLQFSGVKRLLVPEAGEDLVSILKEMGLMHLSEEIWLKLPQRVTASSYLRYMLEQLEASSERSDDAELMILDSTKPVTYYRGRWITSKNATGKFVARRPQKYGNGTWCFVELQAGIIKRICDMPEKINGVQQRGCDSAWHLQLAIDFEMNQPQQYRVRATDCGVIVDFFSPIPIWAKRRLMVIGHPIESSGCLFSYLFTKEDFSEEERFLTDYLWLRRID